MRPRQAAHRKLLSFERLEGETHDEAQVGYHIEDDDRAGDAHIMGRKRAVEQTLGTTRAMATADS